MRFTTSKRSRETRMSESTTEKHNEDNSVTSIESTDTGAGMSNCRSLSLGSGYISKSGRVSFHAAPTPTRFTSSQHEHAQFTQQENSKAKRPSSTKKRLSKMLSAEKILSPVRDTLSSTASQFSDKLLLHPVKFERAKSLFLRVADLQMSETSHSCKSHDDGEIETSPIPNFHHAASLPPPHIEFDPQEQWVAINTGDGSHAPIAPQAIQELSKFGMASAFNEKMWLPDKKTDKLVKGGNHEPLHLGAWKNKGLVTLPARGFLGEEEVMVWTGEFKHGLYGSELPAVRAAGILNMSAKSLADLLLDSERVKEYNEMSLGRAELMVMPGNFEQDGPFGKSVTKVLKSESKPPLLRKVLQFVSIMHAKELEDGSGYLLVTRAVTSKDDHVIDASILRSEILMGVNVIKKVEGDDNRCLMINVNHIRSPMIPTYIAKRLGLSAASNFFHDLRRLNEQSEQQCS